MIVIREREDAPAWASQLLSDAVSLASAVFQNPFHAAGVLRTLRDAIENLEWLPQRDPGNYEWTRVAMIVHKKTAT